MSSRSIFGEGTHREVPVIDTLEIDSSLAQDENYVFACVCVCLSLARSFCLSLRY